MNPRWSPWPVLIIAATVLLALPSFARRGEARSTERSAHSRRNARILPTASGVDFRARYDLASGEHAWALSIGDLNGDGLPDMAVPCAKDTVVVFLDRPGGSPLQTSILLTGGFPSSVQIADFDGDGKNDLCVGDYWSAVLYLFRGHGDGTFDAPRSQALRLFSPRFLAHADLDGDGVQDLVVGHNLSLVSVVRGRGDLTFEPPVEINLPNEFTDLEIADLDRDGKLDIVGALPHGNAVGILWGAGGGTFEPLMTLPGAEGTGEVEVGDVDNDGRTDLVATAYNSERLITLLSTGGRSFTPPIEQSLRHAGALKLADFDGDGVLDAAIGVYEPRVAIARGAGNGHFGEPVPVRIGAPCNWLGVADFDADGAPDFVSVGYTHGEVSVLLNAGAHGTAIPIGSRTLLRTGADPHGVALADLDLDGDLDLVATHFSGASYSVRRNSAGGFGTRRDSPAPLEPSLVSTGDLNADGRPDVVWGNRASHSASVVYGNADGSLQPQDEYSADYGAISAAMGDVDGDGFPDLLVANESFGSLTALTRRLSQRNGYYCGQKPQQVVLADMNGDGVLDAIVPSSYRVTVLMWNGLSFGFIDERNFNVDGAAYAIATGDVDGDGHVDVALAVDSNQVWIMRGDGAGNLAPWSEVAVGRSPRGVALADLDGDGVLDLAVACADENSLRVRTGFGTGFFGRETRVATGRSPRAIAVGDVDGDHRLDLAVACAGSNAVAIHLGDGVTIPNRAPAVADERYEFRADHDVDLAVLDNDEDLDGDVLRIDVLSAGHIGSAAVDLATQRIHYRPFANAWGRDSLTYIVGDGRGGATTATVRLRLRGIDTPPVAHADTARVGAQFFASINVLANDIDPDGDSLRIVAVTQPSGGNASIADSGRTVMYYIGAVPDSFQYTASDGWGGSSVAKVLILPVPPNIPPQFESPLFSGRRPYPHRIVASVGIPMRIEIRASDPDATGPISLDAGDVPDGATLNPPVQTFGNPVHTTFEWTPRADQVGARDLEFLAFDYQGGATWLYLSVDVGTSGFSFDQHVPGTTANLDAVALGPAGSVVVVGAESSFVSRDAGSTWEPMRLPNRRVARAATFHGARLFMSGDGFVATSDDLGATWVPMTVDTSVLWNAVSVGVDGTGIAVGSGGSIVALGATGATPMTSGTRRALLGCQAIGGATYAVGESGLALKFDGGRWTQLSTGTGFDLYGCAFLDERHGFIAGDFGMLRTDDGGANWRAAVQADSLNVPVRAIQATCSGSIWACGPIGSLLFSPDRGETWQIVRSGTEASLNAVALGESGRWVVGQSGACYSLAGPDRIGLPECAVTGPSNACSGSMLVFRTLADGASLAWAVHGGGTIVGPADRESLFVAAQGGLSVVLRRAAGSCASACSLAVAVAECNTRDCPRSAAWWTHSCGRPRHCKRNVPGFTAEQMQAIAAWVDRRSKTFDWSTGEASDGLCRVLTHDPRDAARRLRRQFAALLANVAAAELHLETPSAEAIGVSPGTKVSCRGNATTVDRLIDEVDRTLADSDRARGGHRDGRGDYLRWAGCLGRILRGDAHDHRCTPDAFATEEPENAADAVLDAESNLEIPEVFDGVHVLPNPFQQSTRLTFSIPQAGTRVDFAIYDAAGRRVRDVLRDTRGPGAFQISWDGRDDSGNRTSPGIYFLRWSVGERSGSARMLFLH